MQKSEFSESGVTSFTFFAITISLPCAPAAIVMWREARTALRACPNPPLFIGEGAGPIARNVTPRSPRERLALIGAKGIALKKCIIKSDFWFLIGFFVKKYVRFFWFLFFVLYLDHEFESISKLALVDCTLGACRPLV
jgi:hypothetical protein